MQLRTRRHARLPRALALFSFVFAGAAKFAVAVRFGDDGYYDYNQGTAAQEPHHAETVVENDASVLSVSAGSVHETKPDSITSNIITPETAATDHKSSISLIVDPDDCDCSISKEWMYAPDTVDRISEVVSYSLKSLLRFVFGGLTNEQQKARIMLLDKDNSNTVSESELSFLTGVKAPDLRNLLKHLNVHSFEAGLGTRLSVASLAAVAEVQRVEKLNSAEGLSECRCIDGLTGFKPLPTTVSHTDFQGGLVSSSFLGNITSQLATRILARFREMISMDLDGDGETDMWISPLLMSAKTKQKSIIAASGHAEVRTFDSGALCAETKAATSRPKMSKQAQKNFARPAPKHKKLSPKEYIDYSPIAKGFPTPASPPVAKGGFTPIAKSIYKAPPTPRVTPVRRPVAKATPTPAPMAVSAAAPQLINKTFITAAPTAAPTGATPYNHSSTSASPNTTPVVFFGDTPAPVTTAPFTLLWVNSTTKRTTPTTSMPSATSSPTAAAAMGTLPTMAMAPIAAAAPNVVTTPAAMMPMVVSTPSVATTTSATTTPSVSTTPNAATTPAAASPQAVEAWWRAVMNNTHASSSPFHPKYNNGTTSPIPFAATTPAATAASAASAVPTELPQPTAPTAAPTIATSTTSPTTTTVTPSFTPYETPNPTPFPTPFVFSRFTPLTMPESANASTNASIPPSPVAFAGAIPEAVTTLQDTWLWMGTSSTTTTFMSARQNSASDLVIMTPNPVTTISILPLEVSTSATTMPSAVMTTSAATNSSAATNTTKQSFDSPSNASSTARPFILPSLHNVSSLNGTNYTSSLNELQRSAGELVANDNQRREIEALVTKRKKHKKKAMKNASAVTIHSPENPTGSSIEESENLRKPLILQRRKSRRKALTDSASEADLNQQAEELIKQAGQGQETKLDSDLLKKEAEIAISQADEEVDKIRAEAIAELRQAIGLDDADETEKF
eukprot:TRINITY_DN3762_c0_g2_i1.p1 TRINITY_DN3762_c0_g2~~TRINITY_DN3762_c0_g2_i1.p1  ORF type:complete len:962 (-),score=165.34 TRINITY_DN3762_c0_g2_i1:346-3231(-)